MATQTDLREALSFRNALAQLMRPENLFFPDRHLRLRAHGSRRADRAIELGERWRLAASGCEMSD
jgi:hypothetical protein